MIGVGDKVVCIGEFGPHSGVTVPTKGNVYTVRDVAPGRFPPHDRYTFIRLVEIRNPVADSGGEYRFQIDAFRKVSTPKQFKSIEIFREIDRKVFAGEPVA